MNREEILTIKNKCEAIYLKLDNILYIQADGNYSNIYLTDGSAIKALSYQRAELVRMMEEQLPEESRQRFAPLGRSYTVNTDYVLRIRPGKQLLTFCVNNFGTIHKVSIKATSKALAALVEDINKHVA